MGSGGSKKKEIDEGKKAETALRQKYRDMFGLLDLNKDAQLSLEEVRARKTLSRVVCGYFLCVPSFCTYLRHKACMAKGDLESSFACSDC